MKTYSNLLDGAMSSIKPVKFQIMSELYWHIGLDDALMKKLKEWLCLYFVHSKNKRNFALKAFAANFILTTPYTQLHDSVSTVISV